MEEKTTIGVSPKTKQKLKMISAMETKPLKEVADELATVKLNELLKQLKKD